MKTIKLLLIEDDINLSYIIKSSLEEIIGGYEVDTAANGAEGLVLWKELHPDIIVSDIEMPVMNGLEMVKKIRQTDMKIPIVFVTGKIASKDVTTGYEAGVNNYIKKPFSPEELDAHIKALINLKNDMKVRTKNKLYQVGKYLFDPKNFTLTYDNSEKKGLTARESKILELLSKHKGEIVKREDFLEMFWENQDSTFASRSLDVFISKLRKYLSKDTSISIKTIKTTGLILDFE
ncbi:MAG: response regulator transcription factor [Dysgonamonadaceae bacterium]|jgi:DNA-binding response OmpR family regulator|nr:response regulator transcription factor [Dysgonamonadaceae bacterium]